MVATQLSKTPIKFLKLAKKIIKKSELFNFKIKKKKTWFLQLKCKCTQVKN